MRHFSAKIPSTMIYQLAISGLSRLSADGVDYVDDLIDVHLEILNEHLDGNTPASVEVRNTFIEWCYEMSYAKSDSDIKNGAFSYSNLNTGVTVLFVCRLSEEEYAFSGWLSL